LTGAGQLPEQLDKKSEKAVRCQGCDGVCCKKLQAVTNGLQAFQTDHKAALEFKSGKEAKCADK
jgi:hypothetical protein